jgi:antitoxin PrlF
MTSKGQITIPKKVRAALGAAAGDTLGFEIQDGKVLVSKLAPFDAAWHEAISDTLDEWKSPEDEEAFRDL